MAGSVQGNNYVDWLTFGEAHSVVWASTPTAIGLTAAQVTAYTAKVTAARTRFDTMTVARDAAKAATQNWYDSAQDAYDAASVLIGLIKGYAETQASPNSVYTTALIPVPSGRTPAGPPVDCNNLQASLTNSGNVLLKWKGSVAKSQFFNVWRKLSGETNWIQLGAVSGKTYLDDTVPEASAGAQYQIRAQRGAVVSQGCEPVAIIFGTVVQQQAA